MLFSLWKISPRTATISIWGVLSFSLVLSEWGWRTDATANFYLTPFRVWELLAGALTAIWLRDRVVPSHQALSLIGFFAILLSIHMFDADTPFPSVYTLLPVVGTVFVLGFARPDVIVGRLLAAKPMVAIGLISYSAYLWHQPLFAFARVRTTNDPSYSLMIMLTVVTFVLAYLSWRFVESPFRSKQRISPSRFWQLTSIALVGLVGFSFWGIFSNGNLGRFDQDVLTAELDRYQFNDYVWAQKDALRQQAYTDGSTKLLVVGDSNGGDLVNSLMFTFSERDVSFSTLEIQAGCGNLYLDEPHRSVLVKSCEADWLHLPESQELFRQADLVFQASNWSPLEVEWIRKSMDNLQRDFGDKFWVFGTKATQADAYFYEASKLNLTSTRNFRVRPKVAGQEINKNIASTVPRFIDPYAWMCNGSGCLLAENIELWYLYDGFHLIQAGAESLGNWIKSNFEF